MTRSTQAPRLALALSTAAGVSVRIEWHGSSWHACWVNGPTRPSMITIVGEARQGFPAFEDTEIMTERASTDLAELAALLQRLEDDPGFSMSIARRWEAHDGCEFPERISGPARRRAVALDALGIHSEVTRTRWDEQAAKGFAALATWLDLEQEAMNEGSNVLPFRRRR